jgi:hypothetical protein
MTALLLCTAGWKLRHDEPASADEERCTLHPLPSRADAQGRSLVVRVDEVSGLRDELAEGRIPLAVVRQEPQGWQLSHLLLRLEDHAFQLIRPPRPSAPAIADTPGPLIRAAFADNHLWLNNFECFHAQRAAPPRRVFDLSGRASPDLHARRWHRRLAEHGCPGFRPAFCDELRHFSHRTRCGRLSDGPHDAVAVLELDDKRKPSWDSGHGQVQLRSASTREWSVLERSFAGDVDALLARHGGARGVDWLPSMSQVATEVRCEAEASGNLYALRFEWALPASTGSGCPLGYRAQLSYVKTLGHATNAPLAEELDALARGFARWADSEGLQPAVADPHSLFDLHLAAAAP